MIRSYTELSQLTTFQERYKYLQLRGQVGFETFGHERYANQRFYTSREWRNLRHDIIVRDNGCDLGTADREVMGRIIIHHMNPVKMEHLVNHDEDILNPEFLVSCSHTTHNAIHYGDESLLIPEPVERRPGDTTLW